MIKKLFVVLLLCGLLLTASCASLHVDTSKIIEGSVINVDRWRTLDGNQYITMMLEFRDDQGVLQQSPATFPWNDPIAVRYGHVGSTVCLYPSFGYHHLKIVPCDS